MRPEHKNRVTLSICIICGMLVCAFLSFPHRPHHTAFGFALDGLTLISFWLSYRYNIKHHRQPDTLIHLFPVPPETSKERS